MKKTKKISPTMQRLVSYLNDGQFHSGNALAQQLSISRHAVWKHISNLSNNGVKVIIDKQKGYCLPQPVVLLDADLIYNHLPADIHPIIHKITTLAHVDSTNDYLCTSEPIPSSTFEVCLSEQQATGRGRRLGRAWQAPFAKSICLSLMWCTDQDCSIFTGFSLVAGLAVHQALTDIGISQSLTVKWPNDILYQHKKLAGILLEIHAQANKFTRMVLGVGLNVNVEEDEVQVSQPWTSVAQILGQFVDRNHLTARIITYIIQYTLEFSKKGFSAFLSTWDAVDYLRGQTISIQNLQHIITGQCVGVDEKGCLLIQSADGQIYPCSSGEALLIK